MPDSRIISIHKKLEELIAVDFSAGYSEIDFTNRVIRGIEPDPIMVPHACISFIDAIEDMGPILGRYQGTAIFEIYAFVNGKNATQRNDQAINVCSDMIKAITADRRLSLGNKVDDVKCDFTAVQGDSFGMDNCGIGYIRINVKFQSEDGS